MSDFYHTSNQCASKMEIKTDPEISTEQVCDKIFLSERSLKNHNKSHRDDKALRCTFCNHKAKLRVDLTRHMKLHNEHRQFHCTFCDFQAKLKHHLTKHTKVHNADKQFHCQLCNYQSKSHMKIHTRDEPNMNVIAERNT